jgi:hypothetical protein
MYCMCTCLEILRRINFVTIIVAVVLCRNVSRPLRVERRRRVFENKVLEENMWS